MFRLGKVVYLYGEVFGKLLDENISKSVVPAGLDPLSRGLFPTVGSRRRKMEVGGEFELPGQRLCSRHMKSRRIDEFGRLWACKKPLEVSLKVGSPWKLGGLGGERKCLHGSLKVDPS